MKINRLTVLISDTENLKRKSIGTLEANLDDLQRQHKEMNLDITDDEIITRSRNQNSKTYKDSQVKIEKLNTDIQDIQKEILAKREKDSMSRKKKEEEYAAFEASI